MGAVTEFSFIVFLTFQPLDGTGTTTDQMMVKTSCFFTWPQILAAVADIDSRSRIQQGLYK